MNSKRSIIIIGGGLMQVPVTEAARGLGLITLVMDKNPEAPAFSLADHILRADISDLEAAVKAVESFAASHFVPNAVITAGTDFPTTSARIAERFHLPGLSMETALRAKDKILMRECFARSACSQPRFIPILSESDLGKIPDDFFPLVIKPADSMGARGVRRVDHRPDLKAAYTEAAEYTPTGRVIVEDYIDGQELSIDALVWKNEVMIRGVADRIIEMPPFFIETGHVLPSRLPTPVLENAMNVFRQGIRALGIDNGAAKADIRVNAKGAFIGEIAARLSGGFMSGYTYPYATGVNLLAGAIRIALGEAPGDLSPKTHHTSFEKAILTRPGRVEEISGIEEAKKVPGIKNIFLSVAKGDMVQSPKNNVEKCGNIIAVGSDFEDARRSVEQALALIHLRTNPSV
ncbi:MAG: ATP-grasp domain-containing protein [Spirochaetia bacterium]|nr:ATP-grasp domain-containing protein [Spirochaetia bacterium]